MFRIILKLLFVVIFVIVAYYIIAMQTQKYRSQAIVMVKNLNQEQSISAIGAMLMPESSTAAKDSQLLELYIRSLDTYKILDKSFDLSSYYQSDSIDPLRRLYPDTWLPYIKTTQKNLLSRYNDDLSVIYDPLSSTLELGFLHIDANRSRDILKSIISQSEKMLNEIEKNNAKTILDFLSKQEIKNRKAFIESIQKLIRYQNAHGTIDPKVDVETKSKILAQLESELIQKQVEYRSSLVKKRSSAPSMQALQKSISQIKQSISKIKKQLASKSTGEKLNKNVYDFELLKNDMEFKKEVYKQTLIKIEETKVDLSKNAKRLITISRPTLPDAYDVPDKISEIISLFVVLLLMYGIVSAVLMIIADHRD